MVGCSRDGTPGYLTKFNKWEARGGLNYVDKRKLRKVDNVVRKHKIAKRDYKDRKVNSAFNSNVAWHKQSLSHALFNHYRLKITPPGHSRPNWGMTFKEFEGLYAKANKGSSAYSAKLDAAVTKMQRLRRSNISRRNEKNMISQANKDVKKLLANQYRKQVIKDKFMSAQADKDIRDWVNTKSLRSRKYTIT
jgi:hypothetical protein